MHPNTPYTWLKRFCERTDQPFYGVHHFRHLNATLQIVSGADARTVSANLGHSKTSTTLNLYAHTFDDRARVSDGVGDLLAARKQTASVRDGFPLRNALKWRCPSWTRAAQIRQKPRSGFGAGFFHRNGCFSAHNTQIIPTGQVHILKPQSFNGKTKRKTTLSSFLRNFLTWFLCAFTTL